MMKVKMMKVKIMKVKTMKVKISNNRGLLVIFQKKESFDCMSSNQVLCCQQFCAYFIINVHSLLQITLNKETLVF